MRLDEITYRQAKKAINDDTLVIFPVGSIEQHGSIGPLGTDCFIPAELAKRVEKEVDCLVMPLLPYGICPYHMEYAGSIDLGYDAFYATVNNILLSMMRHGAKRFLILNGHGGNTPALDRASLNIFYHGGLAAQVDWWSLSWYLSESFRGGHGDGQECSAVMAINPDLVHLDEYEKAEYTPLTANLPHQHINNITFKKAPVKIVRSVEAVSPTGEFGPWDSAKTDAMKGEEMLSKCSEYIVDFAKEFVKAPLHKPTRKITEW